MIKRRKFLQYGGVGAAALAMGNVPLKADEEEPEKKSRGATMLILYELIDGDTIPSDSGSGEEVGWAIAVATGSQKLIVPIHLDYAEPDMEFDIYVIINGEWHEEDVGMLMTNSNGIGNAHLSLEIADYPHSVETINVQVEVWGEDVAYASATYPIPLKKPKTAKKKKAKKKAKKKTAKKKKAKKKAK